MLEKNGEMSQHAIAQRLGIWDEHTRYHIDLLVKARILSVRYERRDHQGGTDKLVRIADSAEKLLKDSK